MWTPDLRILCKSFFFKEYNLPFAVIMTVCTSAVVQE